MVRSSRPDFPRLSIVAVSALTLVLTLAVRVAYLAAQPAGASALAPRIPIQAARGSIWDRDGWLLAADRYEYTAVAAPSEIRQADNFAALAAPHLGLAASDVAAIVSDRSSSYAPLQSGLPYGVAKRLRDLDLVGLSIEQQSKRFYPLAADAAHVTGFLLNDGRVCAGIEASADGVLRGQDGTQGGNFGSDPRAYSSPRNGRDVVLTIDRELQVACADILARAVEEEGATGGTVVVIEPATGAVLASVSWPSYDPSRYAEASPDVYRDPVTANVWEPGSIMKPITLAAAFDAGVESPTSTYLDEGSIEYAGIVIANSDHTPHGLTTMTQLMQYSLNVGAVHVVDALGADRFYAALAAFGFGSPTGVDMNGEWPGIVHWPQERDWYPGNLATNSFGQGISVTPMQMISAIAALANGGVLMRPHFIAGLVGPSGEVEAVMPHAVRRVVSPATAAAVRAIMVEVVSGRVTQAAIPGYTVAGKTGTSQVPVPGIGYDKEATVASFVGFLPADDPRFVALVKLDSPTTIFGGDAAAPVFRDVAMACIDTLGIGPDAPRAAAPIGQ